MPLCAQLYIVPAGFSYGGVPDDVETAGASNETRHPSLAICPLHPGLQAARSGESAQFARRCDYLRSGRCGDEKATARGTLAAALAEGGYGARLKIVRINALDTEWGKEDAAAACDMGADAVLLPKVEGPANLDTLAAITGETPLWSMMETPLGISVIAAPMIRITIRMATVPVADLEIQMNVRLIRLS